MEITPNNFIHAHNVLERDLAKCAFVAIDLEFTGIDRAEDTDAGNTTTNSQDNYGKLPSSPESQNHIQEQLRSASETLTTTPEANYLHKKAALDQLTVMQIGLSVFVPEPRDIGASTGQSRSIRDAVAAYLTGSSQTIIDVFRSGACSTTAKRKADAWTVAALLEGLREDFELPLRFAAALEAPHMSPSSAADGYAKSVTDALRVRRTTFMRLLTKNTQVLSATTTTAAASEISAVDRAGENTAENIERLRSSECLAQLIRLYTQWVTDIPPLCRALLASAATPEKGNGTRTPARCADAYRVSTFYAGLFPSSASRTFRNTGLDAETVGNFLAKAGMDFNAWVRSGLRFTTLEEYVTYRAAATLMVATACVDSSEALHKIGGYAELYGAALDELLPLSPVEIRYIRFVLAIPTNSSARAQLAATTAALFMYVRTLGCAGLPVPVTITDATLGSEEVKVLRLLGVEKSHHGYDLSPVTSSVRETSSYAFSDVDGIDGTVVATAGVDPSLSSEYYGIKLLATLLTATQLHGKPLIVHNGYSDLAFLVRTLYGKLPDDYASFKRLCRATFPLVYDTRTLTCSPALSYFANTRGRLENTYKAVHAQAGVRNAGGSAAKSYAWLLGQEARPHFVVNAAAMGGLDPSAAGSSLQAHNAAYDAYLTGCLFAFAKEELLRASLGKATDTKGALGSNFAKSVLAPYEGVLPMYSSLVHVNLKDASTDALLLPKGAPVLVAQGCGVFGFIESMRRAVRDVGGFDVSVMYNGNCYIISVCTPHINPQLAEKKLLMAIDKVRGSRQHNKGAGSLRTVRVDFDDLLYAGSRGGKPQVAYLQNI